MKSSYAPTLAKHSRFTEKSSFYSSWDIKEPFAGSLSSSRVWDMFTIPHPTLAIDLDDTACVLTGTFKSNYVFAFLARRNGRLEVVKLSFRSLRHFAEEDVLEVEQLKSDFLEEISALLGETW